MTEGKSFWVAEGSDVARYDLLKLHYFRDMHYFDNTSSVILSNGERKHKFGFGKTLGMWFSAKFDSFLPILSFSQWFQSVTRAPHKTVCTTAVDMKSCCFPKKCSDGSRERHPGWRDAAGSLRRNSAFPGHWMAFFPITLLWEFLPSQPNTPWRTPWRNKSEMLLGYRKNIGLSL